jgi:3-methyladenine DNA glycosylase AlkC
MLFIRATSGFILAGSMGLKAVVVKPLAAFVMAGAAFHFSRRCVSRRKVTAMKTIEKWSLKLNPKVTTPASEPGLQATRTVRKIGSKI